MRWMIFEEVSLWDNDFENSSTWLDSHRKKYLEQLNPIFHKLYTELVPQTDFCLHYHAGWNSEKPLKELLRIAFQRDKLMGYTQLGPHRADLQLKVNGIPAPDILSQGQQKLAAYALRLSQGKLLQLQANKACIFLIDDLPSELDKDKRMLIAEILKGMDAQLFITGIEAAHLLDLSLAPQARTFHVEQGTVSALNALTLKEVKSK